MKRQENSSINESTYSNRYIVNGRVSHRTRKRNKGKISSKVVRKYFDFLMKIIDKSLEEWENYAKTCNID